MIMIKYFVFGLAFIISACNNAPKGEKAKVIETEVKKDISENSNKFESADVYKVNSQDSKIYWVGSKPTGKHHGVLNCKTGNIYVENKTIVGGKIIFDMNSIDDQSLTGSYKAKLEKHLKSEDFFDVNRYPEASFEILKVNNISQNNYKVTGSLNIKNIVKQIEFNAKINLDGDELLVEAPQFTFDRTLFDIKYKSKKIFPSLKDKFIDDLIGISIKLKAEKKN